MGTFNPQSRIVTNPRLLALRQKPYDLGTVKLDENFQQRELIHSFWSWGGAIKTVTEFSTLDAATLLNLGTKSNHAYSAEGDGLAITNATNLSIQAPHPNSWSKGFFIIHMRGDTYGTPGALFSLRTGSGYPNTVFFRQSDTGVSCRINGSTQTLSTTVQIYGTGAPLRVIGIAWDDAANIRRIYVDGVRRDQATAAFTWADNPDDLVTMGFDPSGGGWISGCILSTMLGVGEWDDGIMCLLTENPYQVLGPS